MSFFVEEEEEEEEEAELVCCDLIAFRFVLVLVKDSLKICQKVNNKMLLSK